MATNWNDEPTGWRGPYGAGCECDLCAKPKERKMEWYKEGYELPKRKNRNRPPERYPIKKLFHEAKKAYAFETEKGVEWFPKAHVLAIREDHILITGWLYARKQKEQTE